MLLALRVRACTKRVSRLSQEAGTFKDQLLARDTLQRWSGLTLQTRVEKIRQDYSVQVTPQGLYHFYRKHKVRFYASSTAYHAAFHKKFVD